MTNIEPQRARLSSIQETALALQPLRRAERLEECYLYWLSVASFPMSMGQRHWVNTFLDHVSDYLTATVGLRSEVFLQFNTIHPDLSDTVLDQAMKLVPIMGFGRRPGVALPPIPTNEDFKPFIEGKKPFKFSDYVGDFCYWFLGKNEKQQRRSFLGFGGLTIMFMPKDPNTKAAKLPIPPKVKEHPSLRALFQQFDLDQVNQQAHSLADKFLKQSLELYADSIPKSPQMQGIPFILPLLRSRDFLDTAEEHQKLFKLCDFYVIESMEDKGILLCSKENHQNALIAILDRMRQSDMPYPEH
jgi:hypothetical protein